MKIPDKCEAIHVLYEDGVKESFKPEGKIEEFEDCYEFQEMSLVENFPSVVILMKNEIRMIRFVKNPR